MNTVKFSVHDSRDVVTVKRKMLNLTVPFNEETKAGEKRKKEAEPRGK